uniref:Uncharacterized protein n=1 Tax=Nothobranchius pienaari TaxID=704102 RepID=A0A1A8LVH7_9TELE
MQSEQKQSGTRSLDAAAEKKKIKKKKRCQVCVNSAAENRGGGGEILQSAFSTAGIQGVICSIKSSSAAAAEGGSRGPEWMVKSGMHLVLQTRAAEQLTSTGQHMEEILLHPTQKPMMACRPFCVKTRNC